MLEYFSLYQILRLGIRENASNYGIGPPIEYDATEIKYDVHESGISTRSIFGPHPSLVDEIIVAPNIVIAAVGFQASTVTCLCNLSLV